MSKKNPELFEKAKRGHITIEHYYAERLLDEIGVESIVEKETDHHGIAMYRNNTTTVATEVREIEFFADGYIKKFVLAEDSDGNMLTYPHPDTREAGRYYVVTWESIPTPKEVYLADYVRKTDKYTDECVTNMSATGLIKAASNILCEIAPAISKTRTKTNNFVVLEGDGVQEIGLVVQNNAVVVSQGYVLVVRDNAAEKVTFDRSVMTIDNDLEIRDLPVPNPVEILDCREFDFSVVHRLAAIVQAEFPDE